MVFRLAVLEERVKELILIYVSRAEVGKVVPSLFERFKCLVYWSYDDEYFHATGDLSNDAPVGSSFGYNTVSYIIRFQLILLLSWNGGSFIFLAWYSAGDGKMIDVLILDRYKCCI